MRSSLLIVCAADDQRRSRPDFKTLPIQDHMELFIDGFEDKSRFQDGAENFKGFKDWDGVGMYQNVLPMIDLSALNGQRNAFRRA